MKHSKSVGSIFRRLSPALLLPILLVFQATGQAQTKIEATMPAKLQVGFSIGIQKINDSSMRYAKSVGIDYIEVGGTGAFIDKKRNFIVSDEALMESARKAKKAADAAGIIIWSIHMPFGKHIDLSEPNDTARQRVVAIHDKIIDKICRILQPKIVLFHPSWFLGLNERPLRITQLIKSCNSLNPTIRGLGATMVIENMLGFELLRSEKLERPLCRTVEETVKIMGLLPKSIGSAIDMNHIKYPEKLILAMGDRLKTLHVADGTGKQENHYLPCSHKGLNDWNKILDALYKVHYKGPFMFECHYQDFKQLPECYNELYQSYITSLKK